jgi:hypothetical protein
MLPVWVKHILHPTLLLAVAVVAQTELEVAAALAVSKQDR